jgi:hypothetical protein
VERVGSHALRPSAGRHLVVMGAGYVHIHQALTSRSGIPQRSLGVVSPLSTGLQRHPMVLLLGLLPRHLRRLLLERGDAFG